MIWVLVGHRGTGKTTIGRRVAALMHRTFADTDDIMQQQTGRTPTELLAQSEERFRLLERQSLEQAPTDAIAAAGGGIIAVPPLMAAIWLRRAGWETVALTARERLRPDLTSAEEVQWMVTTREPRYQVWADAVLDIPNGESPEVSAERVVRLIARMEGAAASPLFQRSWWIGDPDRIDRQILRVRALGAAGVEIRSDLFSAEQVRALKVDPARILFSVRTPSVGWPGVEMVYLDLDRRYRTQASDAGRAAGTIHSDHTEITTPPDFPGEAQEIKWALRLRGFSDVEAYLARGAALRRRYTHVTTVPQGHRWQWLRIYEAVTYNARNYIAGGAFTDEAGSPPWSEWARYATADRTTRWQGRLIALEASIENAAMVDEISCLDISVAPDETMCARTILRRLGIEEIL